MRNVLLISSAPHLSDYVVEQMSFCTDMCAASVMRADFLNLWAPNTCLSATLNISHFMWHRVGVYTLGCVFHFYFFMNIGYEVQVQVQSFKKNGLSQIFVLSQIISWCLVSWDISLSIYILLFPACSATLVKSC